MSEIGEDIKEALEESGTAFTILRDGGNLSGEYCYWTPNKQVTKPFIREYFKEADLYWDTAALTGEVIRFDATGEIHLVMNMTPRIFENEIIQNN